MTNTATHGAGGAQESAWMGRKGQKKEAGEEDKGQDRRPREPEITEEKTWREET